MNHELVAVAVPWCPGKVGRETPVTGVGSQLWLISSENVLHPHPTWPQPAARPHKQRRGRSYSVQSPSCSERARERETRRGASAVLPSSPLCSASAPHASRRLAETHRYACPVPIGTPPSPRGHGSAPPQIRARLPRCATALVRRCGQWRKIELLVLPWQLYARTQTFIWVASVVPGLPTPEKAWLLGPVILDPPLSGIQVPSNSDLVVNFSS